MNFWYLLVLLWLAPAFVLFVALVSLTKVRKDASLVDSEPERDGRTETDQV